MQSRSVNDECCIFSSQMTNPAIQNDFSYYRRTLSRMRINNLAVSARALRAHSCGNTSHYQQAYVLVMHQFTRVQG